MSALFGGKKDGVSPGIYDRAYPMTYRQFKDSFNKIWRTEITEMQVPFLPEALLRYLSKHGKVIGLSATASIQTVFDNWDLAYIKRSCGFKELPDERKAELENYYRSAFQYGGENSPVNIGVDFLCDAISIDDIKEWATAKKGIYGDIFDLEKTGVDYDRLFDMGKDNCFNMNRRYKLIMAMYNFLTHKELHNLRVITNKGYDINSKKNSDAQSIIKSIYEELVSHLAKKDASFKNYINENPAKDCLCFFNGKKFEEQQKTAIKKMEDGKRCLIFSSRKTSGRSVNTIYRCPEAFREQLIKINDFDYYNEDKLLEVDVDALYLECPTHIIPQVQLEDLDIRELGKRAYNKAKKERCLEALVKTASLYWQEGKNSPELSHEECVQRMQELVRQSECGMIIGNKRLSMCPSTKNSYSINLIQALGRNTRTPYRFPQVCIMLDRSWVNSLNFEDNGVKFYLPEVAAVYKSVKSAYEYIPPQIKELDKEEKKIKILKNRIGEALTGMFQKGSEYEVKQYKEYREMLLSHPVLLEEPDKDNDYTRNSYIKLPVGMESYAFKQKFDYEEVKLAYTALGEDSISVPQDTVLSKLQEYVLMPGVKEYFERQGYATTIEIPKDKDCWILNPVALYMYKGALGEAVGQAMFKYFAVGELKELPLEKTELFDFVCEDVVIDFKNWSRDMKGERDVAQNHIKEKMEKYGNVSTGIIINIFPLDKMDEESYINQEHRIFERDGVYFVEYIAKDGKWDEQQIMGIKKVLIERSRKNA